MTHPNTAAASPFPYHSASSDRSRPDRLTVSAAIALLVISALHTLVFALHPWWGQWLAGPFRTTQLPVDAAVQFWGLPGGFVVPGVLLALLILRVGRRGDTVPLYVALILGIWALVCIWIVGPSGFVLLLIPAVLLLIASLRSRRGAERRG
jgi:hypothetical protein